MNGTVMSMTRLLVLASAMAAAGACEAVKSENPLSPTVAGPIAGVSISAPAALSPINGTAVVNTEPLRLVFRNSVSNSQRPFWYVVELSSDSAFNSKIYSNAKVTPGEGADTTVTVTDTLQAERTYYWRVKAEDGANASEFSATAAFDIVGPVSIDPPIPYSPVAGETTANTNPDLTVTNGRVTGRPARVEYRFEVATDAAFTKVVARVSTERSGGSRTTVQSSTLAASTAYYWRALGSDGTVTSAWSVTARFQTPAAGGGGGGGGGGYVPPAPPAPGGRTPDPPVGGKLPLPNMSAVVQQIAAAYPAALRNSCQDQGGTWEFMDRVVDELRKYDSRWGYNWKRGNVGDPSKDAVDYHWGRGADEGSTEVYIIDLIGGHCGPNPTAGWSDVTDVTLNSGTIGRWTGRGRF